MAYYEFSIQNGKLSLKTKLLLALGIVLGLTLLSLFAFTFFIIALVGGAVLFLINLFQNRRIVVPPPRSSIQTHHYRPRRDDDVIDI